MKIAKTVQEIKEYLKNENLVGFVPTMGALHDGHIALIKKCKEDNNTTIVSIFVNPTQFNDKNDFKNYPITIHQDLKILEDLGVNYVFLPSEKELYLDNYTYKVTETDLSHKYCGKSRPGHFDGVLTIVLKLFNIIKPSSVYFGEKDYQQMILIKNMIDALFLDIKLTMVPTVYSGDLALSSRNKLLSNDALILANKFARILKEEKEVSKIIEKLNTAGIEIDYVETFNDRILAAVKIDNVRLIDNVHI